MNIELLNEVLDKLRALPDIDQNALAVIESAAAKGKFQASFAKLDDVTADLLALYSPFAIHPQVPAAPKNIRFIISWYGVELSSSGYTLS